MFRKEFCRFHVSLSVDSRFEIGSDSRNLTKPERKRPKILIKQKKTILEKLGNNRKILKNLEKKSKTYIENKS